MHEMDRTPKVITIIALVLEGLSGLSLIFAGFLLGSILDRDLFLELDPSIPVEELDLILSIYGTMAIVMYVMAFVLITVFIVNVVIFKKLIKGEYSEESARKVYTYQLIWGIINIFINTIGGILHIVSAVSGRNGEREMRHTRDGI
jgi:cytochrome b subunit of formate dehydrogenase